jgi:hypothetical protein
LLKCRVGAVAFAVLAGCSPGDASGPSRTAPGGHAAKPDATGEPKGAIGKSTKPTKAATSTGASTADRERQPSEEQIRAVLAPGSQEGSLLIAAEVLPWARPEAIIASGMTDDGWRWTLGVALREGERTIAYVLAGPDGGGVGSSGGLYDPPLNFGMGQRRDSKTGAPRKRMIYGAVSTRAVNVRVVYADGTTDVLPVYPHALADDRLFFGQPVALTAIKDVQAVDADGNVIASKRPIAFPADL